MNLKRKRLIGAIMIVILIAGLLSGCGQGKEGEEKTSFSAKGRYVEKETELPESIDQAVGIVKAGEDIVLYAWSEEKGYLKFTHQEGKWSEAEEVPWLMDAMNRLEFEIAYLYMGGDGKLYAMGYPLSDDVPYGQHILREAEGQTAEDITPEDLLEADENGMTALLTDMMVLEDGTIGVSTFDSMIEIYKDGKKITEIEGPMINTDHQPTLAASGGTAAIFGKDGKSIDFYKVSNFEKENTVSLGQSLEDGLIAPGEEGVWYIVNSAGIHRITEKGSVVETVMEGSGGMMSMDTATLLNFCQGKQEEFYGLYRVDGQECRLMRYIFDEKAEAVQKETISIYSLKENATVSQAVYAFQSSHPGVKVEYHVGETEEGAQTTEVIRTLNAELLNGGGADVLILDGLPADAYVEKGVLKDITGLAKELTEKGVLKNIINTAVVKNKKIYAVPARVSIPVIYGDENKKKACQTLEAFHAYVNQNGDDGLFEMTTCEFTGMTLFQTFYDELAEKGELSEEKLAEFLEDVMKLCETERTRDYEKDWEMESGMWEQMGTRFYSGDSIENDFVTITELRGLISSIGDCAEVKERGTELEVLKEYYIPATMAGINASSKQQELAEDFLRCLFEEDVQKTDNSDGFPVLESAMEAQTDYVETPEAADFSMNSYVENPVTGEEKKITAGYPSRKETEQLFELLKGLKKPFVEDRMMTSTVLEEMGKCYNGSQSPEEAAKAICQKAGTYLAE